MNASGQFNSVPFSTALSPAAGDGDAQLIAECLEGNEQAWCALIERYKRLIYSIPYKYQASSDDCADIFQSVCVDLYSDLGKLRNTDSLKAWIVRVTVHKCIRWKRQQRNLVELDDAEHGQIASPAMAATDVIGEAEREQLLREAIGKLSPRSAEMIRLLFYEQPPLPYAEVARRLGLATGSIGFIRGRCLRKLAKLLRESGF